MSAIVIISCIPLSFRKIAKRTYQKNYVEKRKTKDGDPVRIYSDEWVKKRWTKKVKKIKDLDKNLEKLRKKYKADLGDNNDAKTRAIAAVVGLIDGTSMRVGNEESAEDAKTFGATTLLKKHVHIEGKKIRFKFVGKSGVKQDHVLDNAAVVSEIKKLLKDKSPNDEVFEYEKGQRVSGKVVNNYLRDFNISAKDIRGHHANAIMKEKLTKTKDFSKALEETAEEVGHQASTLKSQYLDPALVKKYDKKAHLVPLFVKLAVDYKSQLESVFDEILGGTVNTTWKGQSLLPPEQRQKLEQYQKAPVRPSSGRKPGTIASHYDHLSEIFVRVGQEVKKRDVIGLSGHTGNVTGPHLHVERLVNKTPVDPQAYAHEFYPGFPITSGYGARHIPGRAPDTHQATDIGMHDGTPVYAWEDGIVTVVQYGNHTAGNWIELSHFPPAAVG